MELSVEMMEPGVLDFMLLALMSLEAGGGYNVAVDVSGGLMHYVSLRSVITQGCSKKELRCS